MKTIRLRTYLFLMLGLIAGVPAFVLGTLQVRRVAAAQATASDHETLFAARALARQIGQFLDGHVRAIALLGERVKTIRLYQPAALPRLLAEHRSFYGAFERFTVLAADGKRLAVEPPDEGDELASDSRAAELCARSISTGGPVVSQLLAQGGEPGVRIAAPFRDKAGAFAGCVIGSLPTVNVQAMVSQASAEYWGLVAVVLDAQQTVVAHPDDAARRSGLRLSSPLYLPPAARSGESRTGIDDAGVEVRAGIAPIRTHGLGWTTVVYRPESAVDEEAIHHRRQTMIASTIAVLAALVLALLLSLWLARPIGRLAAFAAEVKRGDWLRAPPQQSRWHSREVSLLVDAVSSMAHQLHAHTEDLERQVTTRTAELLSSNGQLAENLDKLNRTQEQLLQAGKMAAVGQLAGGVAHEINNPLAVILGFAQGLERRVPEGDPLRLPVASIAREALRCKALVQELLTFSRVAKKTTEPLSLNELISSTRVLVESRARTQNVELVFDLADDVGVIRANKTQIQQVLVNLSTNAMDAMAAGGRLTFRARRKEGQVRLEVSDTGSGIPAELRARIFEPFFTTKEAGKGTGLGLSLVYEIVQQHSGAIEVESEMGCGTTMTICLPAEAARAEACA